MTIDYFPIAVKLRNKLAVVVGGGKVAERKVNSLLEAGGRVLLIAPVLTLGLNRLFKAGRIKWHKKRFDARGLDSANLIIAATSSPVVNRKVRAWAGKNRALVNVVDQAHLSDFISPAIFQRDKAIVAVYTDGKDPVLSRDLKNFLKENWDVFLSYRRGLQKRPS